MGGQFENMERARKRLLIVIPLALVSILVLLYFTYQAARRSGDSGVGAGVRANRVDDRHDCQYRLFANGCEHGHGRRSAAAPGHGRDRRRHHQHADDAGFVAGPLSMA